MKLLLTGACGFVGQTLARELLQRSSGLEIFGLDNLSRPGSEQNRGASQALGMKIHHGDLRCPSDLESLPPCDFVIDAAANPSVLAGVDGATQSRQLIEHNLLGTFHLLEYCKRHQAGIILLSTSRVYSIAALSAIAVEAKDHAFRPKTANVPGLTPDGITEEFSTQPPLSLYGTSKLASEQLAIEYGAAFQFPVWINRCGVLAGAGQFGKADQGIFSYWIHSYRARRPLRYLGFGGEGFQVRDCLHPKDLGPIIQRQLSGAKAPQISHFGGGNSHSMSLRQLTDWCEKRYGFHHPIEHRLEDRPFDLPWIVLDCRRAREAWDWSPRTPLEEILEEIATHAERFPEWLDLSG